MIHGSEVFGATELDLDTGEVPTRVLPDYGPNTPEHVRNMRRGFWIVGLSLFTILGLAALLLKAILT